MSTFSCQPTKLPFSHLFDAEGIDVRCGTQPGLTRVVHVLVLEHSIKPVAKCSFTKLSCKQRLICVENASTNALCFVRQITARMNEDFEGHHNQDHSLPIPYQERFIKKIVVACRSHARGRH